MSKKVQSKYTVYIVRCSDKTLYAGITTNLNKRLAQHNGEKPGGARYTRGRRPVVVVYTEECATRSEAQSRECVLKKLTRREKLEYIKRIDDR